MGRILRASAAAKYIGVSYLTLYDYTKKGLVPSFTTPRGHHTYDTDDLDKFKTPNNTTSNAPTSDKPVITAFYIRSSNGNKTLLNTQKEQLTQAYGQPYKIYQDKASGLNENRKGLWRAIHDAEQGTITRLCITNKDRITRFGYQYIHQLFQDRGCEIIILNDTEQHKNAHEELIQDFMSLIASFSGKYYRLRGYKQQHQLLDIAQKELSEKEQVNG